MLPTTHGNQELEPIFIGVFSVGGRFDAEFLTHNISFSEKDLISHSNRNYVDIGTNTTMVFLDEQNVDGTLLECCDGVLFILDAATGVSTNAIKIWQELAGLEIPRHIAATNLFQTHTDFDELVAISRRIFSAEVLVRYLPMADDEETKVVALYDLLQNQILDYSAGAQVITTPDAEHVELTADQRDLLFENLAYLGLSDEALHMYQAGITPALSNFEQAWSQEAIVSISPLDGIVGRNVIQNWISLLSNRWSPSVESDEYQTHISAPGFYGIGIANGLARSWGTAHSPIEISNSFGETEPTEGIIELASCILADNISIGETLHEQGQALNLLAPVFD